MTAGPRLPVQLNGGLLVREPHWPEEHPLVHGLFLRYFEYLRQNPAVPIEIRNKDRRPELDDLGKRYTDGSASLLLAFLGEQLSGCAAVQLLPNRAGAAEMKRLYVLPEGRGRGTGRALVQACIAWARRRGAGELLLDTVPEAMPGAVRLYRSLGFEPTERYNDNEGCCFAFFRLGLE